MKRFCSDSTGDGKCDQCENVRVESVRQVCPAFIEARGGKPFPVASDAGEPAGTSGLGDLIEEFLTTLHLTEENYKWMKKLLRFAPTCHCPERKKWFNAQGRKLGVDKLTTQLRSWWRDRKR